MRILHIRLVNFIGIHAARGLKDVEYDFSDIDKPIIQLYGPNRCGKTVLIQQLHPFSSINLNGDERSDLSLILPKEMGMKNIVYEFNNDIYDITHTYKPNSTGTNHTVSSSIKKNGEELNPSGGVNLFNTLINNIFGINKYTFQFIINGTQLASFASMSTVQRKNLLNKAMGIDVYDKIHKMSTDDYRFTNKMLTSLGNSKEYALTKYGSCENLKMFLDQKQSEFDTLTKDLNNVKSQMDVLSGKINTLKTQNITQEINECERVLNMFKTVQNELGEIDNNTYDRLVDEQISLNSDISECKNKRMMLLQDIDNLHSKKEDIENTIRNNKRLKDDYDNMVQMKSDITNKISSISIPIETTQPSTYYVTLISIGKMINNMCREISTCLNENHLKLMTDMICKDIDVAAFIIQEGSLLMDSEKEKTVISRIQSMINTIDGDFYTDKECDKISNCVYWKTHDILSKYFKSLQTTGESNKRFTTYDIEQFDHAYKNVLSIKRMISQSNIEEDMTFMFNIKSIMQNICEHVSGIDVSLIGQYMESAINLETRFRLLSQLNDIEERLKLMENVVISTEDTAETLKILSDQISSKTTESNELMNRINMLTNDISINDRKRMLLSQIKHVNLDDVQKKYQKYLNMNAILSTSISEHDSLESEYYNINNTLVGVNEELKELKRTYEQVIEASDKITSLSADDNMYRIIAEATSSTKGKPVLAIREEIENALIMTNRLLDVMYDGEIEMLTPTIDENNFLLPFRSGSHTSKDVRYGSQSESCLISLALSLSLASSLTKGMIPLLDEIDSPLDIDMIPRCMDMLLEMLIMLKCEQCFVISHHFDNNSKFVYKFEIERM